MPTAEHRLIRATSAEVRHMSEEITEVIEQARTLVNEIDGIVSILQGERPFPHALATPWETRDDKPHRAD